MTKTMTDSLSVPFFMFSDDYDVTKLLAYRKKLQKEQNVKITLLPFIIKAVSLGFKAHPLVNSWISGETDAEGYIKQYVIKKDHNITVAIDSKEGLTVPNIK